MRRSPMVRMRISDLLSDAPVDPEAHLEQARVEHYLANLDEMSPVVVFETPEGLLLVDGYHRVAAARRSGRSTIEAEVKEGTRADALRYAAELGATERGLSYDDAIRRIQLRSGEAGGTTDPG